MLELSEDGLLHPLWRAAGVSPRPLAAESAGPAVAARAPSAGRGGHGGQ
jgi:hypothetical protein